ncbi:IclR family transcriptional regulator [Thioclava sediminum]|uniref:IclR family transcriptional regulator n=1 Tax=Thioclava sediminum TaxID=1915319 RepID=A0ABX3MWP2_9RHOB|nr:HTH-type transcriptional regulator BhcR [Thioclava sediminum]OOY24117.1 IclR family transcriptional regulator [Thioclava sediminum]
MTTPRRKGRPKGFNTDPAQGTILALDRALDVLDLLARHGGLSLSAIARELDQSPATMHRVLATLHARDFVEPEAQDWHIGPAAFRIGSAFLRRTNVFERARPLMQDLMRATGETSNLGVERAGQVLFTGQVETHDPIRAFFPPGTVAPLHASGIGKALLSTYAPDRLDQLLADYDFAQFNDRTIGDAEALRAELERITAQGYAVDDEERTLGMRCIAAPIFDAHGDAVAGISVSGPVQRIPDSRLPVLGHAVAQAAKAISHRIGAA